MDDEHAGLGDSCRADLVGADMGGRLPVHRHRHLVSLVSRRLHLLVRERPRDAASRAIPRTEAPGVVAQGRERADP